MRPQADFVYFAFMDILGYKESLNKDIANTSLDFKDKLIDAASVFNQVNVANYHHQEISDSIFIHSASVGINEFLETIKNIFNHYLSCGLLLRGGISYGRHFESRTITYSLALTEAYMLENQKAIYPRVVIHRAIIDMLTNMSESGSPEHLESLKNSNLVCIDGDFFILNTIDNQNWITIYEKLKTLYEDGKLLINQDERLRQKYVWIHDYLMTKKPKSIRKKPFIEKMIPL